MVEIETIEAIHLKAIRNNFNAYTGKGRDTYASTVTDWLYKLGIVLNDHTWEDLEEKGRTYYYQGVPRYFKTRGGLERWLRENGLYQTVVNARYKLMQMQPQRNSVRR